MASKKLESEEKLLKTPMRVQLAIHGEVTGVFFRDFVRKTADVLQLKGWVRNTPQGTVEVVAEGPRARLEELVDLCRKGPPLAAVERVATKWSDASGEFREFKIVY